MKVVLRADVDGLGRRGDVCEVADGYARNYLVPRGLALKSSAGAASQAVAMRRAAVARAAVVYQDAAELAERLAAKVIAVSAKAAAGGHLYGSVGPADIAAALQAQSGIEVDRRSFVLDSPIKDAGAHLVTCRLHPEVELTVTVEVVPD